MTDAQLQQWLPFDDEVQKPEPVQDFSTLPHYSAAKNDNQRLLNFQWAYKNGDVKALDSIYMLGLEVCRKFISAETHRNRHIKHLSQEERYEKSVDAVSYVVASYLKKPDWFIRQSFTGYLYKRVLHELYYQRKVDKIVDFVDFTLFYKEGDTDDN